MTISFNNDNDVMHSFLNLDSCFYETVFSVGITYDISYSAMILKLTKILVEIQGL